MRSHQRDVHESIEPAVRYAGNGKELEGVYGVPQQKPHNGENNMVNDINGNNDGQEHGQAVRRRPFGPKFLEESQLYASFPHCFKHTALLQAFDIEPKLRRDAEERCCKNEVVCKL